MNLFVTGANGYIGSNFIKRASKLNFKIFALTRKKVNKKIKNVKWLTGTIDKKWAELKKSDVLVHLAAEGGYTRFTNFEKCYNFNVFKSKKLINNAINFGCKKILVISSKKEKKIYSLRINKRLIKIYEKKPDYIYALTKAIFTKFCVNFSKKNKLKLRVIRLFHVYGKNEKKTRLWPALIHAAKKNQDFKMTSGDQETDFNFIDDVIDGLIEATNFEIKNKKFPQIWDMCSGKTMSVKQFAKKIWKRINPKSKIYFSKIKVFDKKNYQALNQNHWKINYTRPELTID
jgi:nucleoside-diphosphate-sugar epimerase